MKKFYLISFIFTLISLSVYSQTKRYVSPLGAGDFTGASWQNASADLQGMINASSSGDEVLVAAGTYKPTEKLQPITYVASPGVGVATTDRDKAFILKGGVKVYGGYNATTGTRDFVASLTILSGDLNEDNVSSDGDCYHVVSARNTSEGAVLDGFTIQHGYANGTADVSGSGTNGLSSLTMPQNSGGAISLRGGNNGIAFENLVIKDNYASGYGGAVAVYMSLTMVSSFKNVQFLNNISGSDGGAIRFYSSSGSPQVKLMNTKFFGNSASGRGGAFYAYGPNASSPIAVDVINSVFYNNSSASATTGGGAISVSTGTNITISNSTFFGNLTSVVGGAGGALLVGSSASCNVTVYNSIFNENSSASGLTDDISKGGAAPIPTLKNTLTQAYGTNGVDGNIVNATPTTLFFSTTATDADFLKLVSGSLALDAGDNSLVSTDVDLAGNPRIRNANVDLGAYELQVGAFLPVSLLYFEAAKRGATSLLNWKTASERNNRKFVIERGSNSNDFTFFKEVAGAGDSNISNSYSVADFSPLGGVNYYKLTQYDFDGKSTLLGIVAVNFELNTAKTIVYPNPASANVWVKPTASGDGIVSLKLISLTGKTMLSSSYTKAASSEGVNFDLKGVPTGSYILWVNKGIVGEEKQTLLVVK